MRTVTSLFWVQLYYRLRQPNHPRGWVTFRLEEFRDTQVLRTQRMRSRRLPELEMVGVPLDLLGPVHGIFMAVMGKLAELEGCVESGQTVGGMFVSSEQTYVEACTLVSAKSVKEQPVMRICDVNDDSCGVPRMLLSTHLCALAEVERNRAERLRLLLRSTELYPVVTCASAAPVSDWRLNPNNFGAWEGLGSEYADGGDFDSAIECWKRAVAYWPVGGLHLAARMCERFRRVRLHSSNIEKAKRFWCGLTVEETKELGRIFGFGP